MIQEVTRAAASYWEIPEAGVTAGLLGVPGWPVRAGQGVPPFSFLVEARMVVAVFDE